MIKGLYYRYQPNGLAVISAASGWSSFHRFLAELCCSKTLEWCRNPVAASGRSLWALTLRNKGKGEEQKIMDQKGTQIKKMPLKNIIKKKISNYKLKVLEIQCQFLSSLAIVTTSTKQLQLLSFWKPLQVMSPQFCIPKGIDDNSGIRSYEEYCLIQSWNNMTEFQDASSRLQV